MNGFNPSDDIHVITSDENDEVKLRFSGNTFAINPSSSGFVMNNDWNNRHFTMGFDENSILYHVTREDEDDRRSGKKAVSPGEAVAEFYGYIRSLAPPVPKDEIPLEFVGRADFEEMKEYMHEKGVVRDTSTGLTVDNEAWDTLEERISSTPGVLGGMFERVFEPVSIEEALDGQGGEHVFFYPTPRMILMLFPFPDGYVGVTTASHVFNFAEVAGGSQIIDHVLRAMSE